MGAVGSLWVTFQTKSNDSILLTSETPRIALYGLVRAERECMEKYKAEDHKLTNAPHLEFKRNDTFLVVIQDTGMKSKLGEQL